MNASSTNDLKKPRQDNTSPVRKSLLSVTLTTSALDAILPTELLP